MDNHVAVMGNESLIFDVNQSTPEDYMGRFSLDILGLEDRPEGDQTTVLEEFKEQLTRREDGKYETALPWKASHPKLPTNLRVARPRFQSLLKRLEKQPALLETYHHIIEDQVEQGIVEIAPTMPEGKHEHYIPLNQLFGNKLNLLKFVLSTTPPRTSTKIVLH